MITAIYKVLGCGDLTQAPSQSQQGGILYKKQIRLQEFAGYNRQDTPDRASNAIVATMLGNLAQCNFYEGDLVLCSFRFGIREYQTQWYQDVTVVDIQKLK